MPSQALRKWRTTQRAELDRLDAAVRAVDASQPALRQQLVDMYIPLLAGQFQATAVRFMTRQPGSSSATSGRRAQACW